MTDKAESHSKSGRENYYVDPEEFHREMVEFKEKHAHLEKGERPDIPDSIGKKLIAICEGHSRHRSFYRSSFRDEMVLDAIERCVRYIMNYDHVKYKNPFNYFTQLAYYSFIDRISREENERNGRLNVSRHELSRILSNSLDMSPTGSEDMIRHEEIMEDVCNKIDSVQQQNETDNKKHKKGKKRTTLYHQKKKKEKKAKESADEKNTIDKIL